MALVPVMLPLLLLLRLPVASRVMVVPRMRPLLVRVLAWVLLAMRLVVLVVSLLPMLPLLVMRLAMRRVLPLAPSVPWLLMCPLVVLLAVALVLTLPVTHLYGMPPGLR